MIDQIYDSAEAFGNALDRVVDKFEDEVNTVVRKSTIDVTEKVKKDTPRDTGRAAAGWILTSDQPSNEVPAEDKYQTNYGEKVPANAPPSTEDPGEAVTFKWWIVNNLEYIEDLENGTSDQAPTGMVANAMNSFSQHLSDQVDGMETLE